MITFVLGFLAGVAACWVGMQVLYYIEIDAFYRRWR